MNDRELLELAAKAAGFYVCNDLDHLGLKEWGPGLWVKAEKFGSYELWNPLTDDGDAFRLAVRLKLILEPALSQCNDVTYTHVGYSELPNTVDAMRAAIVQCAAAIGAAL